MVEFPTARIGVLFWWILSFVVFTTLQLKFNKTPFSVDGVIVCSVSDIIEFFVPLVVVPLYWVVWFKCQRGGKAESIGDVFLMLIGSVLFTHGHGVHLAANSLSNTCHAEAGIKSLCAGSPQLEQYIAALDLFDELISHILWIGGIILFCVALLRSQVLTLSKHGSVIKYQRISFLGGVVYTLFGLVYGVLFACHNIEGGTVLMGLPFCVLIVLYLAGLKRELIVVSPIAFLFFVSHVFTLALLLAYYNMFGGFPEFSQLKGSTIGSFYATTNHKQEL